MALERAQGQDRRRNHRYYGRHRREQARLPAEQHTDQTLAAYKSLWLFGDDVDRRSALAAMLDAIARHRVGQRPNRIEPREVKRRPKPYEKRREPRKVARDRLLRKR